MFSNTTCFRNDVSRISFSQTECSLTECFLAPGYVSVSNDGVRAVQDITGYGKKKTEAVLSFVLSKINQFQSCYEKDWRPEEN